MSMRLALYAHYNPSQQLPRHVFHYLSELRKLGFTVCFISNSALDEASVTELEEFCERIIQRENSGFDFAMWQTAMECYDLSSYSELLLTNSSIVGPIKPLAPLWQSPLLNGCDFWGLTDNDELAPHLQSYFLVFTSKVIGSKCFAQFWRSILHFRDKDQVIRSYEVGLTRWLEQNGFRWSAVYPQSQIIQQFRADMNNRGFVKKLADRLKKVAGKRMKSPGRSTTLFYPDYLIRRGMPFLKYSLLHKGNVRIAPATAYKLLESSEISRELLRGLSPAS